MAQVAVLGVDLQGVLGPVEPRRLFLIMFLLLLELLVDLINRQHFVRRLQVDSYHVHVCLLEGGLQVR